MVNRQLLSSELASECDDMFASPQKMHDLGCEKCGRLDRCDLMPNFGDHSELEALDNYLWKKRTISNEITNRLCQFAEIGLIALQLDVDQTRIPCQSL